MARETTAVTVLTAQIRFDSALHIGGDGTNEQAVARDAAGRPILPGTSLCGALRAALGAAGDDPAWGADDATGPASRVVVHDAVLVAPEGREDREPGRRDGVGIDRALGSAEDERLYGRETLPAGTRANLRIEVQSLRGTEAADRTLLARVRGVLAAGLALGARTRRGLGHAHLLGKSTVREHRYDTARDFWATRIEPRPVGLPAVTAAATDVVEIEIAWRATGPVFVAMGGLDTTQPRRPIMEPVPDSPVRLRQVLPGTAIAGALRSRAELICRTLAGTDTPAGIDAQLLSTPLVVALFGGARGVVSTAASALTVHDCASTTTITEREWLTLLAPAPPRRTEVAGGAELRLTDHVAVDRWTGGAADQRLYSVLEPHGFAYHPIRLRLDRSRLAAADRDPATMLLLLTIRELAQGRVPLGGATRRGHGVVEVDRVRIHGAGIDSDGPPPDLMSDVFADLRAAWRTHLRPADEEPT